MDPSATPSSAPLFSSEDEAENSGAILFYARLGLPYDADRETALKVAGEHPMHVLIDLVGLLYSEEILDILAADAREQVRREVAAAHYTGQETLLRLLTDVDGKVAEAAAYNPSGSTLVICAAAENRNPLVREAAASNLRCPIESVYALLDDTDEAVAHAAILNLLRREDGPLAGQPLLLKRLLALVAAA